jgi:hypothetical protein
VAGERPRPGVHGHGNGPLAAAHCQGAILAQWRTDSPRAGLARSPGPLTEAAGRGHPVIVTGGDPVSVPRTTHPAQLRLRLAAAAWPGPGLPSLSATDLAAPVKTYH